ncbi:MAG TPA: peptidylprolyl isomerase [Bacteroidia bacterium]|jgi:peptidyl-prolyl cis-trans isomerase SurA|nr:peptidylprolyl isomerase [Bacteroidia bacterium]
MKNKIFTTLSIICSSLALSSFAQNDPTILMNVGNRPVTLLEFKSMYYKNLSKDSVKSQKALDNYLKLFTEFRLKVNAAIDAKLDTTASFKQEMNEYRQKLAEPYMRDQSVEDQLVKQAYDRMLTDVHAAHILIKVGPDASPADTLVAYKKIVNLREKIMKKEITFEEAAKENSDDTYSKVKGGDLGYFTGMEMVYPFENAAYETQAGVISQPVRTQFGYHILKIIDRRPDVGQVQVAHIMIRTPAHMSASDSINAKVKIDSIYTFLKQGQSFTDLARKYSQDPSSGRNGGIIQPFGVGKMPAPFEKAAFELKNPGDYSEPIRTDFGWHILKLMNRKKIGSFDSLKDGLAAKVQRDDRSHQATEVLVKEIQKKYGFVEYPKTKEAFYKVIDPTFYTGKWTVDKAKDLNETMFTLSGMGFTQQDFAQFIAHNQMTGENKGAEYAVNVLYPKFVKDQCLKYKNQKLEAENPQFAEMINEYRDGIMLFDITDKMVWSKALKDTAGLKKFYEAHKTNYMWTERCDASIYTCADSKVAKELRKMVKDGKSDKEILAALNAKDPKAVTVQSSLYVKKDNPLLDANWKQGVSDDQTQAGKVVLINVHKVIAPQAKSLDEARGIATTDYQNYLMAQWISDLKAKYPVQVNQQVLQQVIVQ